MTEKYALLVHGGRVVTCDGPADAPAKDRLAIVEDGVVAIGHDGRIAHVGDDLRRQRRRATGKEVPAGDLDGWCVVHSARFAPRRPGH